MVFRKQRFLSGSKVLCLSRLLAQLLIVKRPSTAVADNSPTISQLLNKYRLCTNVDSMGCQAISFCSFCCLGATFNFFLFPVLQSEKYFTFI